MKAVGTHIIPLHVIKLGFVLSGHEFDDDMSEDQNGYQSHHGQLMSRDSMEQQETYRYDQLKAALATLITQVSEPSHKIVTCSK